MSGPVSLVIALVSYGNAYLASVKTNHNLDFNNSTLIYNNKLSFSDTTPTSKSEVIACSPQQWFAWLKKDGCKKLKVYYRHSGNQSQLKDFESTGFVGSGGDWIIEAVYNTYSNYWGFTEEDTKPKAPDDRIWSTHFFVIKHKPSTKSALSIDIAKHNLSVSLTNIIAFALRENQNTWAKIFERAHKNLTDHSPVVDYYEDFISPNSLSLQAKQLLFSASVADVFGGMGSWNDIGYKTKEANELNSKLSADLFDKMNEAVVAAMNH